MTKQKLYLGGLSRTAAVTKTIYHLPKKFILDSLQEVGIIKNDGWDEIISFRDEFYLDRKNPRVEVYIFAPDEKEMV